MTETSAVQPGWYPDPQDPAMVRWWNGASWTEYRHAAGANLPGPAHGAPGNGGPGNGGSTHPGAPPAAVPSTARGATGPTSTGAAYPAAAPYDARTQARRDIPTNTAWIWLVVLLPLLTIPTIFLVDWRGYIDATVAASLDDTPDPSMFDATFAPLLGSFGILLLTWLVQAGVIVSAFLDWRQLRDRGIVRPFHWAWIFLTLVATNGVYVIGRGVILHRQTGKGLTPIWVWIGVTVLSWIIGGIFASVVLSYVFEMLPDVIDQTGYLVR